MTLEFDQFKMNGRVDNNGKFRKKAIDGNFGAFVATGIIHSNAMKHTMERGKRPKCIDEI